MADRFVELTKRLREHSEYDYRVAAEAIELLSGACEYYEETLQKSERKTGKWTNLSGETEVCGDKKYECSSCKIDMWMTEYAAKNFYKFCPNCGAMMVTDDEV